MPDIEQSVLEQSFQSPDTVARDIENNPEAKKIVEGLIASNSGLLWRIRGHKNLAELLNADAIYQSNQSYESSEDLIRTSNRNYWASIAFAELSKTTEYTGHLRQIAKILYGRETEDPNEQEGQELMRRSLEFGDVAVKAPDFKPEEIQYIVSSYIFPGYIFPRDAPSKTDRGTPLLVRFLRDMERERGLEETLDFFDRELIDGPIDHPFSYQGWTFIDPYIVKRNNLFLDWESMYRDNPELSVRLAKTFANFSVRAFADKQFINRYPNPQAPWNDIRDCVGVVKKVFSLSGDRFFDKLEELGFERIIVEALRAKDSGGYSISGLSSSTAVDSISQDRYYQSRGFISQSPEEKEALNIFGFTQLPSELELTRKYKELMRTWHPDKSGLPNAKDMAPKITSAYSLLSERIGK